MENLDILLIHAMIKENVSNELETLISASCYSYFCSTVNQLDWWIYLLKLSEKQKQSIASDLCLEIERENLSFRQDAVSRNIEDDELLKKKTAYQSMRNVTALSLLNLFTRVIKQDIRTRYNSTSSTKENWLHHQLICTNHANSIEQSH